MSTIFKCDECGGTEVYELVWVNPNDGDTVEGPGRTWCDDCQQEGSSITAVRGGDAPSMFSSLAIALKPDFTFG